MQRVQVLKSGKYKFVKNPGKGGKKRAKSSRKKTKTKKKGKKRSYSRKKKGGNVTKKNNKLTHRRLNDICAVGDAAIRQGLGYLESDNPAWITNGLPEVYTGYNIQAKNWKAGRLARGWTAPATRYIEKKGYKAIGIREPRLKIDTLNDVLNLATYHGGGIIQALPQTSPRGQWQEYSRVAYGNNLQYNDTRCVDLRSWFFKKQLPYIANKKIIQPVLKKVLR